MRIVSATAVLPDAGKRLKSAGLAAVFAVASVGAAVAPLFYYQNASAATATVVKDLNANGWTKFTRDTGTISISNEHGAPAGFGVESLSIKTPLSNDKAYAKYTLPSPIDLDNLTVLNYSSFRDSSSTAIPGAAPALNLEIDFNGAADGGYSTLVYEPIYQTGGAAGVVPETWQQWQAALDTAKWWSTRPIGAAPNVDTFPTLAEIKAANPDAVVGTVAVNQGGGNPGLVGAADALTINETTFNFEVTEPVTPPVVVTPENKDDCKNNGWKTVKTADNKSFKNQGQCVSYVEKNSKEVRGNIRYSAGNLNREAWFNMDTANDRGWFVYSDANRDWYGVRISEVKVDGNTAWFAGQVDRSKNKKFNGNWLFAKVVDGNPDTISGSFTTKALAEAGVEAKTAPTDGPFNVTRGNIRIKD